MAKDNENLTDAELRGLTNTQIVAAVREGKLTEKAAATFIYARLSSKLDRQIAKAAA